MRGRKPIFVFVLVIAALSAIGGGCIIGRAVSVTIDYNIHNDITSRGFLYVKKGVEATYEVRGIYPAKLGRKAVLEKMNIAQIAYGRLWRAAGGLKDKQRFINVMIEASFVRVSGFGRELYLVVNMYADMIQFQTPSPPPASPVGSMHKHPAKQKMVRMIRKSIAAARMRALRTERT